MGQIRREVYNSFPPADSNCDFIVHENDVISVIPKLNSGKSNGNGCLSTDHFKNACDDLSFICHVYSPGCLFVVLCQMICSLVMLYRFLKVTRKASKKLSCGEMQYA